jgi:hypothetical protein
MRVTWLAVDLGLALALLAPATARAGFSTQIVPVSGAAPSLGLADAAVNDAGDAFLLWVVDGPNDTSVLEGRRVKPNGVLGAVLTLSDGTQRAGSAGAAVAYAPGGSALVAWSERVGFGAGSMRARWISPNDDLGPQLTLRNGGVASNSGEVAVTGRADGGATVAWHNFTSNPGPFRKVEGRNVAPDGSVGALLQPTSGGGSLNVRLAPDSVGGALFVWKQGSSVEAQGIGGNDAIGPLVPQTAAASSSAALAGDGQDRFQVVYRTGNNPYALFYRRLGADGTSLSPELALDVPGSTFVGASPDVATNAAGRSLVGWSRFDGERDVVKARFIGSDGIPELETFSARDPTGTQKGPPRVGIGGSGGGAIAWVLSTGASSTVWGRIVPPSGSPSAPVLLSSGAGGASGVAMEIGPADVGVVAWTELISGTEQAFVRQLLPAPACFDAKATVVQGRPTQVHLGCTGLQLMAPEVTAPPAHGTLSPADAASQSVVYTPTPGYEGLDGFEFRGVNPGGVGDTRTAMIAVGRDTIPPEITRFAVSTQRLLASRAAIAAARKKRERLTTADFTLEYSEPATATITIERKQRCPKRARRCKPYTEVGTLKAATPGTGAALTLGARVGKRTLRPGRYRASAVATDLAGNRSEVKQLTFRKVRRRKTLQAAEVLGADAAGCVETVASGVGRTEYTDASVRPRALWL